MVGVSGSPFEIATGFGGGAMFSDSTGFAAGFGAGVSSTVECFPVVHGGIERNSSKVKTRGLQQFQPGDISQHVDHFERDLERVSGHLSALHGILVDRGGKRSPHQGR